MKRNVIAGSLRSVVERLTPMLRLFFGTFGRFSSCIRQTDRHENGNTYARHQALCGVRGAFADLLAEGPMRTVRSRRCAGNDQRGKSAALGENDGHRC